MREVNSAEEGADFVFLTAFGPCQGGSSQGKEEEKGSE